MGVVRDLYTRLMGRHYPRPVVLRSPTALALASLVMAGACGGKVSDEPVATRQNGTTRPSEPFYPVEPQPTAPPPPSFPPPPPTYAKDAGAPTDEPESELTLGGPRCPKRLPRDRAGCGPQHGSKCEYAVTAVDGGVCRWFCSCSSPPDSNDTTLAVWSCGLGDCR